MATYRTKKHFRFIQNSEKLKQNLERETLLGSDITIFNNTYQKDFMLKNHNLNDPEDKFIVLPHSFDSSLYPTQKKSENNHNSDIINMVYIGHLDGIRTPINILKAIKRLKTKKPNIYKKLRLDFYGNIAEADRLYIFDNDLFQQVRVKKPILYLDSLKVMSENDWCLLVDANLTPVIDENVYFAAKLADYLGSKSKILAVTMLDGASADIIRETNNVLCSHSVDDIYITLCSILENPPSLRYQKQNSKNDPTLSYDNKVVAKKFDSVFEKLVLGE